MDEFVKYLKALVYIQAHTLSQDAAKAEVLLAKAGLPYKEIALVMGKNEMAVAKTINRAKHSSMKGKSNE